MKNEFDLPHGEQLEIDRANDVSPDPVTVPDYPHDPKRPLTATGTRITPVDAAMQYSTLRGIPRDRDFVDPEVVDKFTKMKIETDVMCETFGHQLLVNSMGVSFKPETVVPKPAADALSDWDKDTITVKLEPDQSPEWQCPACEPDNGTPLAYHPECYRQQQEDTLFKRTWMIVGGVILLLSGVGLLAHYLLK